MKPVKVQIWKTLPRCQPPSWYANLRQGLHLFLWQMSRFRQSGFLWTGSIQLPGYAHTPVCNFLCTSCRFCNLSNSNCAASGPRSGMSHSTIHPRAICSWRHQRRVALEDSVQHGEEIIQNDLLNLLGELKFQAHVKVTVSHLKKYY